MKWSVGSVVKKKKKKAPQLWPCSTTDVTKMEAMRNQEITTLNLTLGASAFIPSHMTQIRARPALSAAVASSSSSSGLRSTESCSVNSGVLVSKTITSGQWHRSQRFWTRYLATSAWHHVMLAVERTDVFKGNLLIFNVVLARPLNDLEIVVERYKQFAHTSEEIIWSCIYLHQRRSAFKFLTLAGSSGDEKWTFLQHIPTI